MEIIRETAAVTCPSDAAKKSAQETRRTNNRRAAVSFHWLLHMNRSQPVLLSNAVLQASHYHLQRGFSFFVHVCPIWTTLFTWSWNKCLWISRNISLGVRSWYLTKYVELIKIYKFCLNSSRCGQYLKECTEEMLSGFIECDICGVNIFEIINSYTRWVDVRACVMCGMLKRTFTKYVDIRLRLSSKDIPKLTTVLITKWPTTEHSAQRCHTYVTCFLASKNNSLPPECRNLTLRTDMRPFSRSYFWNTRVLGPLKAL
jgi:hypothetical protein